MVGHVYRNERTVCAIALVFALSVTCSVARAGDADADRIKQLEAALEALQDEVVELREQQDEDREEHTRELTEILEEMSQFDGFYDRPKRWYDRFRIGTYGEMHANFNDGSPGENQFDIHRLVLYVGYDFNDWIELTSETEVEHAFVSDDSGGEVVVEQLYLDFKIDRRINARVGRILTPMGIINQKHEPTTFNGVERPSFAKYIIPTTWASDGIGIFGDLGKRWEYQLYLVNGLDGSGFNATDGIRGGRMKERPGYNEPAITGRVDYHAFRGREMPYDQRLRIGASGYWGGLDNGNKGKRPGVNGDIQIYSMDAEYTISKFDFRGAVAYTNINGARDIGNGTASGIFGWYLEGAYHFWPESFKKGKLKDSDAVVFTRFDWFDTQARMPSGVSADPAGQRHEWTFGVTFFPVEELVLKADYQIRFDETGESPDNRINFGVGWAF
jgi:hypothetical protein